MRIPPSPHIHTLNLIHAFNARQAELPGAFAAANLGLHGEQVIRGMPFACGAHDAPNVILLDDNEVAVNCGGALAAYILFLHAVENHDADLPPDLAEIGHAVNAGGGAAGNRLGDRVSDYRLEYADGQTVTAPVLRRFAIQQTRIGWGASPFAAVPASEPFISPSNTELFLSGDHPVVPYGRAETRHMSGRDVALGLGRPQLWIYAMPNPNPQKPIARLLCKPVAERSVIYAISHTRLSEHPLRPAPRRKLRLALPEGAALNPIGELTRVDIDLGVVISARAVLDYDRDEWMGPRRDVQPRPSDSEVIIEYSAHPAAKLFVGVGDADDPDAYTSYDLADLPSAQPGRITEVNPAHKPVRLRITEKGTNKPAAVRLHLHGADGEYLPPKGNHRRVNPHWFEDNYGEFVNGLNQYAYIHGECVVDLPLGEVFIEATRGYEVAPLRASFTVTPDTDVVEFELERVLDWRARGWVSADTHVHFLSPQTALLEGGAEGVNVVNLLASQWGEMFSNVSDFDGRSTIGAKDFGGDGEYIVRVGTENRMQTLGHISLLGYTGAMIQPLCSGGPSESALGDALEVTMADWARRCIDQNGLVVMPHAPNPQGERAADVVLGLVHAIEMMTFNPFDYQISPYGVADWYRFLNLGYHIPVVGGSDKMSAASLLGGVRTYAHLGDREFNYDNWMQAVKDGHTFVTVGPLADITVEGVPPGGSVQLPANGATLAVEWRVESVAMPIERVEVVVGGLSTEVIEVGGRQNASGSVDVKVDRSTWIALRVRGGYGDNPSEIAAHTSAVLAITEGRALFSEPDAIQVLEQIEGAMAYVDTLAPRPDAVRFKKLRQTLESAYNRLHQRMHNAGVYHEHTPLHNHDEHHEH